MIVICDSCNTRFRVNLEELNEDGRMVRCTECGHEWFQEPEEDEELEEFVGEEEIIEDEIEEEDVSEVIEEEVSIETKPSRPPPKIEEAPNTGNKSGYLAAAVLFVIIFGGLFAMKDTVTSMWPDTYAVYKYVGLNEQLLTNSDISFERFEAIRSDAQLTISGMIYNLSDQDITLPPLKIGMIDQSDETLGHIILKLDNPMIEGEGVLKISEVIKLDAQSDFNIIEVRPTTFLDRNLSSQ